MADPKSLRYGTDKKTGKEKPEQKLQVHFRPLGTKLCIQPISGEQTTSFGIIIPDNAAGEKPQEGWVLAIGEEIDTNVKKIAVGDRVLFSRYAGDEIRIKDEKGIEHELKILHYESLLGVVELPHDKPKNAPALE